MLFYFVLVIYLFIYLFIYVFFLGGGGGGVGGSLSEFYGNPKSFFCNEFSSPSPSVLLKFLIIAGYCSETIVVESKCPCKQIFKKW